MLDLSKLADTVYKIIGAAMTVHSELSWGLLEAVYQESLHLELLDRGIDNQREKEIQVYYKKHLLEKKYKMDIVVDDIVVELKSVTKLASAHRAQLCNYLRLTRKPLGLLINFGEESLIGERWAYDADTNKCFIVDRNMEPISEADYSYLLDTDNDEQVINE
mgnify:CR=1 FL=1